MPRPIRALNRSRLTEAPPHHFRSCALIHRHRPDLLDYDALSKSPSKAAENLAKAFSIAAEHLGIPVRRLDRISAATVPD